MKIIGKTAEDRLLLDASPQEVARLIGFYSNWKDRGCPPLVPGTEIKVSPMYEQLYELKSSEKTLSRIAADLRAYADRLETHEPIVRAAVSPVEGERS